MRGNKNLSLIYLICLAVGILLIICGFLFFDGRKTSVFFYPDMEYSALTPERRKLAFNPKKHFYEVLLVKEYLLGPLEYHLRLNISPELIAHNIWVVEDPEGKGNKTVIIDFNEEFDRELKYNNDGLEWMIKGLKQTLKENTGVRRLFLLENGKRKKAELGKWQIYHPLTFTD
jgi:hypothetical protein